MIYKLIGGFLAKMWTAPRRHTFTNRGCLTRSMWKL